MVEKLNYYDAIAHLIPGTLGCIVIVLTWNYLDIPVPKLDVTMLTELGIGISVAYTLGHLLQSLSSSLEPIYFLLWGGQPSIRLLEKETKQFSDQQRKSIIEGAIQFFKVQEQVPAARSGAKKYHQRLFGRCAALCHRNNLGRVETFNATYAFHRVLLTTFFLAFITFLMLFAMQHIGGLSILASQAQFLKSLLILTGAGTWIEFFRTRKRAYYYAREVLWMTSDFMNAK